MPTLRQGIQILWWKLRHPRWHVCQHQGCLNQGIQCILYDPHRDDVETCWFCVDHCEKNGFCWSCGHFWAGVEAFDFAQERGGIKGLCPDCQDEFRSDLGEYDDDEYAYDYEDLP